MNGMSKPFKLRWLAERGTAASHLFVYSSLHVGQRGTMALEHGLWGKNKNDALRGLHTNALTHSVTRHPNITPCRQHDARVVTHNEQQHRAHTPRSNLPNTNHAAHSSINQVLIAHRRPHSYSSLLRSSVFLPHPFHHFIS